MSSSYPKISVSKFFEDMVNEGEIAPTSMDGVGADPNIPDLREVPEVSIDEFFGKKPSRQARQSISENKTITPTKAKQELVSLMEDFAKLMRRANALLSEMSGATTVGAIGVGPQVGLGEKPKKKEPKKRTVVLKKKRKL